MRKDEVWKKRRNDERIRNEWLNGIGNGGPPLRVRKAKRVDGSR
jgi:hypothetical protein